MIRRELTDAEKLTAVAWAEEKLVPWADVWAIFDDPKYLEGMQLIGGALPDASLRPIAEAATLEVGGSYGGLSFRNSPLFKDLDFFFEVPVGSASLDPAQVDHLRKIFLVRRMDSELRKHAKDGAVVSVIGDEKISTQFFVGVRQNGVLWNITSICGACGTRIYDLDQLVQGDILYHTACVP